MKKYIKDDKIRTASQIIVIQGDMQVINPTEDMILADGWAEYTEPEPTLDDIKDAKISQLEEYDKSENVNLFYVNEMPMWYDAPKRATIRNLVESNIKVGNDRITLWTEQEPIVPLDFDCQDALLMLAQLEVYAGESLSVTQQHKADILALETKEEVEAYDHTAGYPEKLHFDN